MCDSITRADFRGAISSVIGDRYVISDENEKLLYKDGRNLCRWSTKESPSYDEIFSDKNFTVQDVINTPNESHFFYFVELI